MTVNRVFNEWKDRPVKYKTVAVDGFLDKGYHHTWERLWLFMAAVSDARKKGTLKPATEINQEWVGPIWNEEHSITCTRPGAGGSSERMAVPILPPSCTS